jgi:ABC-type transport system involved in cytochrome c biogenesis permease subunit
MTQVGAMQTPMLSWPSPSVRSAWLLLHVMMILSGYAALLLTAVASVFYLIQERQLKMKKGVKLFSRLPPLGTLDNLITNSMGFGFVFITLGVIAGSTWASIESGTAWIKDPRIALAFITWGFYLTMVFLRATAGWRGRKAALMAVAVLCCSALTWAAHVGLRQMLAK